MSAELEDKNVYAQDAVLWKKTHVRLMRNGLKFRRKPAFIPSR